MSFCPTFSFDVPDGQFTAILAYGSEEVYQVFILGEPHYRPIDTHSHLVLFSHFLETLHDIQCQSHVVVQLLRSRWLI